MISTKYTIREHNEANILNTIIQSKEISRAELATTSGLNKASVSSITKKLLEEELIFETRIGNASNLGGRKPIMLSFNTKSATALSFDLGYDYIEAMITYMDGTIIETFRKKDFHVTAANVVSYVEEIANMLIAKSPSTPHGTIGMCLAIHGLVYQEEISFTPYYDLESINFLSELDSIFNFPIYLVNEANLAALGEYSFSSKYEHLVSISIHSGIGAGIVEEGKLLVGRNGKAGEIGHSILFPDGKECPCGNHGCIEQYASNKEIYEDFTLLKKLDFANSDTLTDYYQANDRETITFLEERMKYLSIGINNIIMLYDPEVVVLNSSICRKNPKLISVISEYLTSHFAKDIVIENTSLGEYSTLLGGVSTCIQSFLNIQQLKFKIVDETI